MPDPEKLESEPPVTVISDAMKSVAASERVKVIAAVSPALSEVTSDEMAIVGRPPCRIDNRRDHPQARTPLEPHRPPATSQQHGVARLGGGPLLVGRYRDARRPPR